MVLRNDTTKKSPYNILFSFFLFSKLKDRRCKSVAHLGGELYRKRKTESESPSKHFQIKSTSKNYNSPSPFLKIGIDFHEKCWKFLDCFSHGNSEIITIFFWIPPSLCSESVDFSWNFEIVSKMFFENLENCFSNISWKILLWDLTPKLIFD